MATSYRNPESINVVLFGVGASGKIVASYLIEKGVNIVGAINRKSGVGQDLGEFIGLGRKLNTLVTNNPEEVLSRTRVDVAVVTTCSDFESLYPIAEICFRHGANVVTIAEEVFFPSPEKADIASKLNDLAVKYQVSLLSTGVQDAYWFELPIALTGSCVSLSRVTGKAKVNIDYLGAALIEAYPLGLTEEQFNDMMSSDSGKERFNICGSALEGLVQHLGFSVVKRTTCREPIFEDTDILCTTLNKILKAGTTVGTKEIYTIETQQGTTWSVEFFEKVCGPAEPQFLAWDIAGVPNLNVEIKDFPGMEVTAAVPVNRILDVINAAPGYLTVADMPRNKFRL